MSFYPIPDEDIDLTIEQFRTMIYEEDGSLPTDDKIIQALSWFIAEYVAAQIKLMERRDVARLQSKR